jgi:PAP2 superfamily
VSAAQVDRPGLGVRAARIAFWLAGLRLTALFGVGFYGAEWWAARQTRWHQLGMAWEAVIPWWPPAYGMYFSVLLVPFLVLLRVHDAQAVRTWERRMALALALGVACFVLWPAQLSYPEPSADQGERWAGLRQLAQLIAGRHNLLPSLHVALSGITIFALWPWLGLAARLAISLWWLALMASILLTHQHHVADLLAGLLLALLAHHALPTPLTPPPRPTP